MKRILLCAVLLLVAVGANGSELYDSFGDMRSQIRRTLNYDTTSTTLVSNELLNSKIREGIVLLAPAVKYNRVVWKLTTQYRQSEYAIDSGLVDILRVWWSKNDSVKSLLYLPRERWLPMDTDQIHARTSGYEGYQKRPSYYDFNDDYLYLFPVPTLKTSASDTIKVEGYRITDDLDTVTVLSTIDEKYRTAILAYAVYEVAKSLQRGDVEVFYRDFQTALGLVQPVKPRGEPVEESR